MRSMTLSATSEIAKIIASVTKANEPLDIKSDYGRVVVLPFEEWSAISETRYIESIPGLVESLRQADQQPRNEWMNAKDLDW